MISGSESVSQRQRGKGWVIAQLALIALVFTLAPLAPSPREIAWTAFLGKILLVVSGATALAGFASLGRNLTPNPRPRANAKLVCHGIYAYMRHPLYTSLMLGSVGWALAWHSSAALATAAVLSLVLNAKARLEERWLNERFPEYEAYARRVKRFLPWIY